MIQILLVLLCGTRFINPVVSNPPITHVIVVEGDSNTDASWFTADSSWPQQTELLLDNEQVYWYNVAASGRTVAQMIDRAAEVDSILPSPATGILIDLGGVNDIFAGGLSQDSVYTLYKQYCLDRQSAGWYMIACTYPHPSLDEFNDSLIANNATFSDAFINIWADPNIGDGSDHNNTTYWRDVTHMSAVGLSIFSDSAYSVLGGLI